jgi:hypothetical protein
MTGTNSGRPLLPERVTRAAQFVSAVAPGLLALSGAQVRSGLALRAQRLQPRVKRWDNPVVKTINQDRRAAGSMIKLSITKYFYFLFIQYIYFMEPYYKTLQTIFNITREDSQPTTYKCRPREIILRQFQDWSEIQQHLHLLETEGLIHTRQEETLVIQITHQGIAKIVGSNLLVTGD